MTITKIEVGFYSVNHPEIGWRRLEVMAIVKGHVMCRYKGAMPFVRTKKYLLPDLIAHEAIKVKK